MLIRRPYLLHIITYTLCRQSAELLNVWQVHTVSSGL
jgi:hypothetical protein